MGPGPHSIWALVHPSKLSRAYLGQACPFSCCQDRMKHATTDLVRDDIHFAKKSQRLGKTQVSTKYPCPISIPRPCAGVSNIVEDHGAWTASFLAIQPGMFLQRSMSRLWEIPTSLLQALV
jgi:hypothetical protein